MQAVQVHNVTPLEQLPDETVMNFTEFVSLSAEEVKHLVTGWRGRTIGVAMPFNGTRRWYVNTFQVPANQFFTNWPHYLQTTNGALRNLAAMLFDDGVAALYMPLMGRALAERGEAYMSAASEAIAAVADDESMAFYADHGIAASCYGELTLLPDSVQQRLKRLEQTSGNPYKLRYGVMADRPLPDLIARTVRLTGQLGMAPTPHQLMADYYGGEPIPAHFWLGSDQPSVYDVPYVVNEETALYFLHFPTPSLNQTMWRRVLYDYLVVRGDEETLYPDNTGSYEITGLGMRRNGYWTPSTV